MFIVGWFSDVEEILLGRKMVKTGGEEDEPP